MNRAEAIAILALAFAVGDRFQDNALLGILAMLVAVAMCNSIEGKK